MRRVWRRRVPGSGATSRGAFEGGPERFEVGAEMGVAETMAGGFNGLESSEDGWWLRKVCLEAPEVLVAG